MTHLTTHVDAMQCDKINNLHCIVVRRMAIGNRNVQLTALSISEESVELCEILLPPMAAFET